MLIGAWRRENETRVWPSLRGALATKQTTLCLRHGRATLSVVIARLDRATQYSEAFLIRSKGRGILDPPHARGMTVFCGAARCVYLVAWIASRSARNDVIDCLTNAPRFTVIARSVSDEANHSSCGMDAPPSQSSSPGSTGRPSNRRRRKLKLDVAYYWIPPHARG